MSAVLFQCPHCRQIFLGDSADVGAVSRCSACGNDFTLAAPAGSAPAPLPSGISWYFRMFQCYFRFRGRARRREFFWAFFFHTVVMTVVGLIDGLFGLDEWFLGGVYLATAVPLLALQVRRLHDTGKSGWWFLLPAVPVVNLAYVVWLFQKGDEGENRFGPDPCLEP